MTDWKFGSVYVQPSVLIQHEHTVAPSPRSGGLRAKSRSKEEDRIGRGSECRAKSGLDSRVLFCVQPRTKERRKTEKRRGRLSRAESPTDAGAVRANCVSIELNAARMLLLLSATE